MALHLAYDGSTHADWVSNYAARLAEGLPEREFHLLHVEEPSLSRGELDERVARIERACRLREIGVRVHPLPRGSASIAATLLAAVPSGAEHYLVCGTRVAQREQGFLSGTVGEQLLRATPCNVLAIRVVQPGFLGDPHELLVPVSGHPRGFASGLPFLRLFATRVRALHLLLIEQVGGRAFRRLRHADAEALRQRGRAYLDRIERELGAEPKLSGCARCREVVVSDDVPKEIALAAARTRSQLIYLGASERTLPQRFVYGNPLEQVLRNAPCDVAVYRGRT